MGGLIWWPSRLNPTPELPGYHTGVTNGPIGTTGAPAADQAARVGPHLTIPPLVLGKTAAPVRQQLRQADWYVTDHTSSRFWALRGQSGVLFAQPTTAGLGFTQPPVSLRAPIRVSAHGKHAGGI